MHCGLIPQFKESFALQGGGVSQCHGVLAVQRDPCNVERALHCRRGSCTAGGGGEVLKAGQSYDAKGFLQC